MTKENTELIDKVLTILNSKNYNNCVYLGRGSTFTVPDEFLGWAIPDNAAIDRVRYELELVWSERKWIGNAINVFYFSRKDSEIAKLNVNKNQNLSIRKLAL